MDNDKLYHHGVKGMHWGVRKKDQPKTWKTKTKRGETITITKDKRSAIGNAVQKISGSNFDNYTARNKEDKKIGSIQLDLKNKDEMNVIWMDTKNGHKGKGYATAVLKTGEKIAKEMGAQKITAEVVGNSPDMLHITDKRGYVRKGEIKTQEVLDTWGGLTLVEKRL